MLTCLPNVQRKLSRLSPCSHLDCLFYRTSSFRFSLLTHHYAIAKTSAGPSQSVEEKFVPTPNDLHLIVTGQTHSLSKRALLIALRCTHPIWPCRMHTHWRIMPQYTTGSCSRLMRRLLCDDFFTADGHCLWPNKFKPKQTQEAYP
jgi:hypothetical protein